MFITTKQLKRKYRMYCRYKSSTVKPPAQVDIMSFRAYAYHCLSGDVDIYADLDTKISRIHHKMWARQVTA